MKRYALFGGEKWEQAGGWLDFMRAADTVEDALPTRNDPIYEWWHVIDLTTGKVAACIGRDVQWFKERGMWPEEPTASEAPVPSS